LGAIVGGSLQSRFGTARTFVYARTGNLAFIALVVICLGIRREDSFRTQKQMVIGEGNREEANTK